MSPSTSLPQDAFKAHRPGWWTLPSLRPQRPRARRYGRVHGALPRSPLCRGDAVIPCPVCSQPMPPRNPWGHARLTCSRTCGISQGNTKRQTRSRARNQDVDEVVVLRLIDGDPVTSTRGERLTAVAILTRRGRSAAWIAESLHITERTICRYRAELHRREVAA